MPPHTPANPAPSGPRPDAPPPAPGSPDRTPPDAPRPAGTRPALPALPGSARRPCPAPPRWTGRNHRPGPRGDQPGPVETPTTPSGPRKAHHARKPGPGQTTRPRRKSSAQAKQSGPGRRKPAPATYLLYIEIGPGSRRPDQPGPACQNAPDRISGPGPRRPGSTPDALPEISTSRPGRREEAPAQEAPAPRRTPCRPWPCRDRPGPAPATKRTKNSP